MVMKITLFESASMCCPDYSTVGAQLQGQRWTNNSTSTVQTLVLVPCWACVSTPTMTCCQQLQPLPNVGPTIACYLGIPLCITKKQQIFNLIESHIEIRKKIMLSKIFFSQMGSISSTKSRVIKPYIYSISIGIFYLFF